VIKQVIVMESYFQSLVRSKSDTRDGATSVAPLKYKSGGLYIPLSDRGPTPPSVFQLLYYFYLAATISDPAINAVN